MRYNQYQYYDPFKDREMVRFSGFNDHGHEYFVMFPANERASSIREHRNQAMEAIDLAITLRKDPGEVFIQ